MSNPMCDAINALSIRVVDELVRVEASDINTNLVIECILDSLAKLDESPIPGFGFKNALAWFGFYSDLKVLVMCKREAQAELEPRLSDCDVFLFKTWHTTLNAEINRVFEDRVFAQYNARLQDFTSVSTTDRTVMLFDKTTEIKNLPKYGRPWSDKPLGQ